MSVGKLATILSLDATGWTKGLDGAAQDVDKFGANVRKKFKGMQDGIAEQKLATTPFNIRKQAGLDLAAAATNQKYGQALATEKVKQLGGGSVGGLLKGLGSGGTEFAGLLKQAGGGSVLQGISGALSGSGGMGSVVGSLAGLLGSLVNPVTAAVGAMAAVVLGFKMLGDSMAGFVELYSPATAARWQAAWDDLYAVIGRDLVPALQAMTEGVRNVADKMAKDGLGTTYLKTLGKNLVSGGIWGTWDLFSKDKDSAGASVGMAAKQASIMTDVGELGRKNLTAAYETAANSPQERANELLGNIAAATADMAAEMRRQRPDNGQAALRGT